MEPLQCLVWIAVLLLLLSFSYKLIVSPTKQHHHKNLPPSPPRLPIIGHFHLLKNPIHQSLNRLTDQYGPILFLWFGSRPVLSLSSPSAIEECLTKNDIIFANRPRFLAAKHFGYNFTNVATASYGDHWRNLRRLTAIEIFSTTRLQMSSSTREEEVRNVIKQMLKGYNNHDHHNGMLRKVELKSVFCKLTFNVASRMIVANKAFFGEEEMVEAEKGRERVEQLCDMFYTKGTYALGDFIPCLSWIDRWTVEKKIVKFHLKRDAVMQSFIEEYRSSAREGIKERKRGILDVLMSMQEADPDSYTDDIIKGILLVS